MCVFCDSIGCLALFLMTLIHNLIVYTHTCFQNHDPRHFVANHFFIAISALFHRNNFHSLDPISRWLFFKLKLPEPRLLWAYLGRLCKHRGWSSVFLYCGPRPVSRKYLIKRVYEILWFFYENPFSAYL